MGKIFKISFLFYAILLLVNACSVNYSFTGADIPLEASNFSIRTFQVQAPKASPVYGQVLTESLKDLMLQQTRLDLAENRGELQFEGTVTGYDLTNAGITAGDVAALNRLNITIRVKYINTFDKEKNFERNFSRFADYNAQQDFATVEAELIEEINRQLTQDIIDAAFGNW